MNATVALDWAKGYLIARVVPPCGCELAWWGTDLRILGIVTDPADEEGAADVIASLSAYVDVHPCPRPGLDAWLGPG